MSSLAPGLGAGGGSAWRLGPRAGVGPARWRSECGGCAAGDDCEKAEGRGCDNVRSSAADATACDESARRASGSGSGSGTRPRGLGFRPGSNCCPARCKELLAAVRTCPPDVPGPLRPPFVSFLRSHLSRRARMHVVAPGATTCPPVLARTLRAVAAAGTQVLGLAHGGAAECRFERGACRIMRF